MRIQYRVGDATTPVEQKPVIIVHCVNSIGKWGSGFVLAVSKRWSAPKELYQKWYYERAHNDFGLGAVQFVPVEVAMWVANLVGQHGIYAENGVPPIRYPAIEQGLRKVGEFAKYMGATVVMPRMGAGLAQGRWEIIEGLVEQCLCAEGVPVTVYDLAT